MISVQGVEYALIQALGYCGEKVLMRIAAKGFVRRRDLSLAADRAFELDPASVVPFWGCRVHRRSGPCAMCMFEAEFPADNRQSAGSGPEVGSDAVPAVAPTSGPLTPECDFAAATFPQHTGSS